MSNELMKVKQEEGKLSCPVVRDLLPNYIEHLTSDETNMLIENHLEGCTDCSQIKQMMVSDIKADKAPQDPDVKRIMVRTRNRMLVQGVFLWAGILGILVNGIVDLAVNRALTWSLIVDGGIAFGYLVILTLVKSTSHRFLKTLTAVSIALLPFLYLIQTVVNANFLTVPCYWMASYAVPISLLWLGLLWVTAILKGLLHLNLWQTIAALMIGSLAGSPVTNMIAEKKPLLEAYLQNLGYISTSITFVVILVLLSVGHNRKGKEKKFEM